jgi:hypothetical protein
MEELDDFVINVKLFLDRSLAFYGASDTGKTTAIKDVLYHLRNMISQIFVFAPSDPSNGDYTDSGVIPKPLVHYSLDVDMLTKIWKRQEAFAAVYKRANKLETLEALFLKLKLNTVNVLLNAAKNCKNQKIDDIKDQFLDKNKQMKKIKEVEKTFEDFQTVLYKKYINDHKHNINRQYLNEEEAFALKYITFNPRTVIIFDDCAAQFKELKRQKNKVLDEILYRGRHVYITTFISCQDDKNLDSDLRKNTFINVFTTQQCANAYFTRAANTFDKDTIRKADKASKLAFSQDHQKMVYVRKENKFYKYTASLREAFEFGSPIIRYYCDKIQNDGINLGDDNKFLNYFKS